MKRIEWHGLYAESWGDDLVPEAYAHPAKYSRGLIRQIYRYMLDEGMMTEGDTVGDPFGGQAGGALDAMLNGLHWRGVELEPRFVDLGGQNIALWNGRYAPHMRRWGTAVLVQGDSRRFAEIVEGLGGVVSSPPYAGARIGGMESMRRCNDSVGDYGSTPGQLGSMPPGDLDAAISSPPYADTIERGDGPGARFDPEGHPGKPDKISSAASYGTTAGQVGRLDAAVSSPPFENSITGGNDGTIDRTASQIKSRKNAGPLNKDYGSTPGNIGNDTGDTFWSASRAIVEHVYTALKPGGYVAWVTGDFVRKGKRVHFGRQWLALCEACGFEPVTWAVAWKTEYNGTQRSLFGDDVEKRKDRVSFFRRLANEKNPDAAVLNEDVIFMRKPIEEVMPNNNPE